MLVIAEVFSQLKWVQMSLPKAQSLGDFAIFDSASRGPLGSLRLLYLWKPHSSMLPPMAYAASLITVAALAMGPFTQQVISVQADNLVPADDMNSTIAVANYYNRRPAANDLELFIDEDGTIVADLHDPMALDVDPGIQGAFYDGYYDLGKSSIDFNCPSSNCSWEIFNSLGVCSACRNVTENAQVIINNRTTLGPQNMPIIENYTIQTPGGWSIELGVIDLVAAAAEQSFLGSTLDTLSANLVSMIIVQRPFQPFEQPVVDYYFTTECSISWCAKQYSNVTIVRLCLNPITPEF